MHAMEPDLQHLAKCQRRFETAARMAALACLCILLWASAAGVAKAGLARSVQACSEDTVGTALLEAKTGLDKAMRFGDWRAARRYVDDLLPLIDTSMPLIPNLVQRDAVEDADTRVVELLPDRISRHCVPEALRALQGFFTALALTDLSAEAEQAANEYVVSLSSSPPSEADIAAQKKSVAVFSKLTRDIRVLDEVSPNEATKQISVWHEISGPRLDLEDDGAAAPGCAAAASGGFRALLIGKSNYRGQPLDGPQNDIRLIETSLQEKGVKDADLIVLKEDAVSRSAVVASMKQMVAEAECTDFVLFYYSAASLKYAALKRRDTPGLRTVLVVDKSLENNLANEDVIWGHEISQFVTAIRNKGASIMLVLDTAYAEGLDIGAYQELAARANVTEWSGQAIDTKELMQERQQGQIAFSPTPLNAERGDFALFYGARADQDVLDGIPFQDRQTDKETRYGIFSYAFATALQSLDDPTIRGVALRIAESFPKLSEPAAQAPGASVAHAAVTPVFEASNPEMVFLGGGTVGELGVEILAPEALRGAMVYDTPEQNLTLIARLMQPQLTRVLTVNNEQVRFDDQGHFEATIKLQPGKNTITIGTTDAHDRYRKKTVTFTYEGDLERFTAQGERYALVIGNQDYADDDTFPDLRTPHKDAAEVVAVLGNDFGFKTEIEVSGEMHSLHLEDATGAEINAALSVLRRNLTKHDVLLIYYAGHGVILEDTGDAFWVPTDGLHDEDATWLSADRLRRTVKRMKARSVLIVADSCFSGAMTRAPKELEYFDPESRERALKKAAELQSRVFMTSGGEEPVQDEDRLVAGHSPFAGAFLRGLRAMNYDVFSTRELFNAVYDYVSGNTPQEPQFQQLKDSGHLGGDFVFTRKVAESTSNN
jgi:hypothetical protein